MEISRVIAREAIGLSMHPTSKDEWLEQLVDMVCRAWGIRNRSAILEAVTKREDTHSTAIGHGVAIPHAKCPVVPRLHIALGIAPTGVEFGALDGEPVRIAFLVLSPDSVTGPHVRALATISRIAIRAGVPEQIIAAKTPREVLRIIKREEETL